MKELPENIGKNILSDVGLAVPDGQHVFEADERVDISPPVVVKAQVPISGRGHKGGIRFAESTAEMQEAIADLLGSSIDGQTVQSVLVEEFIDVHDEYYIALSADGSDRLPSFMFSFQGGQDVESIPDEYIINQQVNPLIGLQPFHIRTSINMLTKVSVPSEYDVPTELLQEFALSMWTLFQEHDLRLLEINPLGITDNNVIAMDAKPVIDDHATFRQDHEVIHSSLSDLEQEADQKGVDLRVGDGRVGIVSNGAGLGLATLDMVTKLLDTEFAGFIDTHGTQFESEDVKQFIHYLEQAGSDMILFNIQGPIIDCEAVGNDLIEAVKDQNTIPIVARFKGLNADKAIKMCEQADIETTTEMHDAVIKTGQLLSEADV